MQIVVRGRPTLPQKAREGWGNPHFGNYERVGQPPCIYLPIIRTMSVSSPSDCLLFWLTHVNQSGKHAPMTQSRATEDVTELLGEIKGDRTLTKFAKDLRVSKAYLSRVMSGNKRPSDKLLKRAGIRKTVKINYEVFPGAKKGE